MGGSLSGGCLYLYSNTVYIQSDNWSRVTTVPTRPTVYYTKLDWGWHVTCDSWPFGMSTGSKYGGEFPHHQMGNPRLCQVKLGEHLRICTHTCVQTLWGWPAPNWRVGHEQPTGVSRSEGSSPSPDRGSCTSIVDGISDTKLDSPWGYPARLGVDQKPDSVGRSILMGPPRRKEMQFLNIQRLKSSPNDIWTSYHN